MVVPHEFGATEARCRRAGIFGGIGRRAAAALLSGIRSVRASRFAADGNVSRAVLRAAVNGSTATHGRAIDSAPTNSDGTVKFNSERTIRNTGFNGLTADGRAPGCTDDCHRAHSRRCAAISTLITSAGIDGALRNQLDTLSLRAAGRRVPP